MKDLKHEKDTNSYMQLCLQLEGGNKIYLMVPTYWDSIKEQWLAAITLTESKKILHTHGKDSFELQNNFNALLHQSFQDNPDETFAMFKPLEYWESRL